jgi:hypothetical protein
VPVNHGVVFIVFAVAALFTLLSDHHQPRGESYETSFANRCALSCFVNTNENGAVPRQVFSRPGLRLWHFLFELLLKLLEANEGYKRRGAGGAEIILGQILMRMSAVLIRSAG